MAIIKLVSKYIHGEKFLINRIKGFFYKAFGKSQAILGLTMTLKKT
jgi:hypothetical protein